MGGKSNIIITIDLHFKQRSLFMKNELEKLLKSQSNYLVEGEFNKNKVSELARKYDPHLLQILMSNEKISDHFFSKINSKIWVFKLNDFLQFINNKEFLPDSFTAYKTKIGLATKDNRYLSENNDVILNFPYKDCILEGGQTQENSKRQEIFFNEILGAEEINRLLDTKVLTNFKLFNNTGKHNVKSIKENDNLLIKGNNLIALYTLKKRYAGKVNTIYIDPPFNTGNDSFKYNDHFNESTWLTFMKNRLEVAKDFLTDDGNIFIHIDVNEDHVLKVLADSIFGKENFVEEIIWGYGSASGGRAASPKPVNIHDYILHYAKNYHSRKQIKTYTAYSKDYIDQWFKYTDEDGRRYRKRQRGKDANGQPIWNRQYLDESKGVPLTTLWTDIKQIYANPQAYKESNRATSEIEFAFGNSGQKPEKLLQRIIQMSTEKGDIVLDFFAGTGTTMATALKMNRQFIGIEQMNDQIAIEKNRLTDVIKGKKSGISKDIGWTGGGSFIYTELKNDAEDFKNKVYKAQSSKNILGLFKLARKSSFLSYRVNPKMLKEKEFSRLSLAEQKQTILQLIDTNDLYVNYDDIDDLSYGVSENEKKLNKEFYGE